MTTDYVLGNDQAELDRLKLQHDLWRDELLRLWDLSRLRSSKKIIDLGCGPGYTSLDLLKYTSYQSELTSVDISENFLSYLKFQIEQLPGQAPQHITLQSFIENLDLPGQKFESAFCRWLMIFVQSPEKAIQRIHAHLHSGSEFIIQEYVSYDSMDLVPNSRLMKPIVEAIFKSWKDQGGDPNRGKYLPQLLEKNGFKIKHLEPRAKFARPHEALWQWPDSFYKSFLPRLVKSSYLSQSQVDNFFSEWTEAQKTPGSFFVAPTVINIIAEKL